MRFYSSHCASLRAPALGAAAALATLLAAGIASGQASAAEDIACAAPPPQTRKERFNFEDSPELTAFASTLTPDLIIGEITFTRYNVFNLEDPKESNWLYGLANRFNIITWESVIRQQLLVAEGDPYNAARLAESERLLRNLGFIFDARVLPVRRCGEVVDLEVVTRDVWTLTPTIGLSRSGGGNSYSLGISDSNVLGSGKEVALYTESDPDRSGHTLIYRDPAVLGSRWVMRMTYSDNDDGYYRNLGLQRPFFSVYTDWSAGGRATQGKLEQATWFRGDEVTEFEHTFDQYTLFGGVGVNLVEGKRVGRWRYGLYRETNQFSFSDSNIPPDQLPDDRDYAYPFIDYESTEDEFIKVINMNYIGRTEDVYVGERYRWRLGWSDDSFGATRDQLAFRASYLNTLAASDRRLWEVDTELSGFWTVEDNEFENFWWTIHSSYIQRHTDKQSLFVGARFDYTRGLTDDLQVVLGGDNGLRGYDRNYQVGDRSFVISLEERYYSDWHPFRLVRVGAAAFLDVGRAWYEDRDNGANGGVLANAGIGLRFNSSRASLGRVIHVDLAFPLTGGDDVDSVQILFRARARF